MPDPLYLLHEPRSWDKMELPVVEKAAIKRWILRDQLPRVISVYGDPGVGKTSLAKLIIQSKLCLNRQPGEYEPCGECEVCRREPSQFTASTGVHWIAPVGSAEGDTEYQAVKAAQKAIEETPFGYGESDRSHRFIVFEEAQRLSTTSLSKLLYTCDVKDTFENVTIILLSMESDAINGPVKEAFGSRGVVIRLPRPTSKQIKNFLLGRLPIQEECAEMIADFSESYREALSKVEWVCQIWQERDDEELEETLEALTADFFAAALHAIPVEGRLELWEYIANGQRKEVNALLTQWQEPLESLDVLGDVNPEHLVQLLSEDLRQACQDDDDVLIYIELMAQVERRAAWFNLNTLCQKLVGTDVAKKVVDHLTNRENS